MTSPIVRSGLAPVVFVLASSFFVTSCTKAAPEAVDPLVGDSASPDSLQLTSNGSYSVATETSSPRVDPGLDAIRTFANQPNLQLEFKETTTFINSPNADVLVDIYQDDWGASYYMDPDRNQVVQFNIGYLLAPLGEPLSEEELRAIAEGLFDRELSSFPGAIDDLSFEQGFKDPVNHFFRWQNSSGGWLYNPPIFQVGLRADGTLLTYINTLGYR